MCKTSCWPFGKLLTFTNITKFYIHNVKIEGDGEEFKVNETTKTNRIAFVFIVAILSALVV